MKKLIFATLLIVMGCSGTKTVSTMPSEKSDECTFSEEVCREAELMQQEYNAASEEQKKDLIPVLNSYIEHCENARKACKKSMR